jgi:hypothetical protein
MSLKTKKALLYLDSDQPRIKWNILQAIRAIMAVLWFDVTTTIISNN